MDFDKIFIKDASPTKMGGQAVMEGIMMRNQDQYAVAVRKPDKEIDVKVFDYKGPSKNNKIKDLPILRGIINFIDSLYLGMTTLMYSSSFFEEEEETEKELSDEEKMALKDKKKKEESVFMGGTVVLSILLAVAIFFIVPYGISSIFQLFIQTHWVLALIEGVIRLGIFIAYISLITLMPDIKRTFMYHGAEHKTINCLEAGDELTVENIMRHTRFHKRCGTSFLFIVMIVSITFLIILAIVAT